MSANVELHEFFLEKRVLVTGNTGFKGSWLCAWLQTLGAEVVGFSLNVPTKPALFPHLERATKVRTFWGDIGDKEQLEKVIFEVRPDLIFHLAAQPIVTEAFRDPWSTWKTNTLGTINLLEVIRNRNENLLGAVFVTSDKVYKNKNWLWSYRENDEIWGTDPYSASKAGAELAIQSYLESNLLDSESRRIATVRAGNVIGGGDWAIGRIVPDAIRAWSEKTSIKLRSPSATRPWQHVLEPLGGYLMTGMLLAKGKLPSGEAFNFGPEIGVQRSVLELIEALQDNFDDGKNFGFEIEDQVVNESQLLALSSEKARAQLGWRPLLNFEETAEWTVRWYKEFFEGSDPAHLVLKQIDSYKELISKEISWCQPSESTK